MNNYRTNCNNRRVMPGSSQSIQRMETMQDNCRSRICNTIQNNSNNNCGCNEVQNNSSNGCGCNEVQGGQNNNGSCNEVQNNQNCTCTCTCTCTCNEVQGSDDTNCGCDTKPEYSACRPEPTLDGFPIGMAYVPIQQWRRLYDICTAFRNGTLFQELNLDFLGRRCN